jgi:monoamine oxidase
MDIVKETPSDPAATPHTYKLAIVGAGLSGLVAAFRALRRGMPGSDIIIYEAQNYVGGRIQKVEHGGQRFDAGAHWLHGLKGNGVYDWLNENWSDEKLGAKLQEGLGVGRSDELAISSLNDLFIEDKMPHLWLRDPFGNVDTDSKFFKAGREIANRLYENFKESLPPENKNKDISLGDLVESQLASLPPDQAKTVENWTDIIARTWMAADAKSISANEYFSEPAGLGGLQVKGGMVRLVEAIESVLRSQGVKFETSRQVLKVTENAPDQFTLDYQTAETPKTNGSIKANAVYVTPSAGVLQSGIIEFNPPLPKEATDVINDFHMAKLAKVLIPFKPGFLAAAGVESNTRVVLLRENDSPIYAHCRSAGTDTVTILRKGASVEDAEFLLNSGIFRDKSGVYGDCKDEITASPKVVDSSENIFLGGSYSNSRVGTQRPEGNIVLGELGGLILGGEGFTTNKKGASTLEGAVVSGEEVIEGLFKRQPSLFTQAPSRSLTL